MKYILVNYNFDPSWVKKYTDDYLIYDRSDSDEWLKDIPKDKVIKTANLGNVDYDRLSYIIDNYYNLPEVFLLSKSNLFKFITKEEFELVKDNKTFTPLLTQGHKTYMPVCFYDEKGMYNEINNSWYLQSHISMYYRSYTEFANAFMLPSPAYLAFAPGGNYIVTKENVYKYGKSFYEDLRAILPYCQLPGEAHFIERTYYTLWS